MDDGKGAEKVRAMPTLEQLEQRRVVGPTMMGAAGDDEKNRGNGGGL